MVGTDFGALAVFLVAILHPERVSGVITLGVPFMLPGPSTIHAHLLPKGFYITRWQVLELSLKVLLQVSVKNEFVMLQ